MSYRPHPDDADSHRIWLIGRRLSQSLLSVFKRGSLSGTPARDQAAAAADIEGAYEWYESRHAGRGVESLAVHQVVQDRLVEQPEAHPVVHRNARRALIQRRFPYALAVMFFPIARTTTDAESYPGGNTARDARRGMMPR
jgi:hypothetical protein